MNQEKKLLIRDAFYAGLIFAVIFGLVQSVMSTVQFAAITAPIGGIIFGAFTYFFISSKKVNDQTQILMFDGDEILHSGRANHFKGVEAVGGKLYLLKNRIQFKSHGFNIQNHQYSIELTTISAINFYNSLGIVPNGLSITTNTGTIEKFVVSNRKKWKQEIQNAVSNLKK